MNKVPNEILYQILRFMSTEELCKLQRINRRFNYFICANLCVLPRNPVLVVVTPRCRDHGENLYGSDKSYLAAVKFIWQTTTLAVRMCCIYVFDGCIRFPINIPQEQDDRSRQRQVAECLSFRTGNSIGIVEGRTLEISVSNHVAAAEYLILLISRRFEIQTLYMDCHPNPSIHRDIVLLPLLRAGIKMTRIEFFGKTTKEEVLVLHFAFGVKVFGFSQLECEKFTAMAVSKSLLDDLLHFQHLFGFESSKDYEEISWNKVIRTIQSWKTHKLDQIAFGYIVNDIDQKLINLQEEFQMIPIPFCLSFIPTQLSPHNYAIGRIGGSLLISVLCFESLTRLRMFSVPFDISKGIDYEIYRFLVSDDRFYSKLFSS